MRGRRNSAQIEQFVNCAYQMDPKQAEQGSVLTAEIKRKCPFSLTVRQESKRQDHLTTVTA